MPPPTTTHPSSDFQATFPDRALLLCLRSANGISFSLMKLRVALWFCSLVVLSGCASSALDETEPRRSTSPTTALLRGEIAADEYLDALTAANVETRREEEHERNKPETRAYNTRTGRFEYVPTDTVQEWNEETGRWEFTPPDDKRNPPR